MKIKPSISLASLREPYWWLNDTHGLRHVSLIHAYKACKPDVKDISIYGLIIGPLHLRIGIAT